MTDTIDPIVFSPELVQQIGKDRIKDLIAYFEKSPTLRDLLNDFSKKGGRIVPPNVANGEQGGFFDPNSPPDHRRILLGPEFFTQKDGTDGDIAESIAHELGHALRPNGSISKPRTSIGDAVQKGVLQEVVAILEEYQVGKELGLPRLHSDIDGKLKAQLDDLAREY